MSMRSSPCALLIGSLVAAVSCSGGGEPYVRESYLMGTKAIVTIYGMRADRADSAAAAGMREMHRIESILSTWRPQSDLSRLNAAPGGEPVRVPSEVIEVLGQAYAFSELTGGAFDVTARPLVRLWGFQGGEPVLPTDEQIEAARRLVGWRKISFDTQGSTVTLRDGATVDVAGIGKGYAVDRCAAVLRAHGARRALVNLGGNMRAIGAPPGKNGWTIGIRDPESEADLIGRLAIRDEAVSTSGNYENFVTIDGRRYGHIIDPRTGRPVDHALAVTVVAPTATAADAFSTGMFVLGPEGSRAVALIDPSIRAVFVLPGGRIDTVGSFDGRFSMEPPGEEARSD
jgi:thiamine biosynthesis lipoprotein